MKLFDFLEKLVGWIPVLWRDQDWGGDYSILEILSYKLGRVKKCVQEGHGIKKDRNRITKHISQAQDLIKELNRDELCKKEWRAHDKKWGTLYMSFDKTPIQGKDYKEVKLLRRNVKTKKDEKQESKEFKKLMNLEWKTRKDMTHKLFIILEKNMREWWD